MSTPYFDADQVDALRELANIGMGTAGAALGQILELEVQLSIPTVEVVEAAAVVQLVNDEIARSDRVLARQAFSHGLNGEAVLVADKAFAIVDGVEEDATPFHNDDELILEITNIMASAFLGSMAEPLGATLYFSPPAILRSALEMEEYDRDWDFALMLNVALGAGREGDTKLFFVFPETAIENLSASVNKVLEGL